MKNLNTLKYEEASNDAQVIFDQLKKKIGMVPNLYATVAHSPKTLSAVLQFGEALNSGEFNTKEVEAIALAIAQENGCHYCLAAHTAVGKMSGLTEDEILNLRGGDSKDSKLHALAHLAQEIVQTQGYPKNESIQSFFNEGYSKAALVELIGFVSLNIFRNYFNHIAETDIDFPVAPELQKA